KLLAIFYDERTKQLPDLPTVKEALPGLVTVPSWFGFMGPAGLQAPIVTRLEIEVKKALEDPEVANKLGDVGIVPIGSTAIEMGRLMRRQTDDLNPLPKQAGNLPHLYPTGASPKTTCRVDPRPTSP